MGKIHGSMARAGKVKQLVGRRKPQCEKKKKKTGRAEKRRLYNDRFIDIHNAAF